MKRTGADRVMNRNNNHDEESRIDINPVKDGARLGVMLQPASSRDGFNGIMNKAVKIRVKASPVEGKANAALIKFLSSKLRVPKSSISIVSGKTSKRKIIEIAGLAEPDLRNRLDDLLKDSG